jgi:hypothetical protein
MFSSTQLETWLRKNVAIAAPVRKIAGRYEYTNRAFPRKSAMRVA